MFNLKKKKKKNAELSTQEDIGIKIKLSLFHLQNARRMHHDKLRIPLGP